MGNIVKHRKSNPYKNKQWEKRQKQAFIPIDPYIMSKRIHGMITYTLQLFAAVWIGLEVAIPPNPYKTHLIVILLILIVHKYHIVGKLINTLEKWSGKEW